MLKIKKSKNGNSVPTWMVTFADLMTLLLTFFVLLLSYSSMDAKKYKQASDSLYRAFHKNKFIGEESGGRSMIKLPSHHQDTAPQKKQKRKEVEKEKEIEKEIKKKIEEKKQREKIINKWYDKTKVTLSKEIGDNVLHIKKLENGILVSVKEHFAFTSGSEKLQASFIPHLKKIASIFPAGKAKIIVAGHTDSQPIVSNHTTFRSNWDLSTLRATSVVHKLLKITDIPADKVIAQGHADSKPIASNKTRKGRLINRRVEITLLPVSVSSSKPLKGGNINEQP